jgi:hypothetical protein
MPGSVITRRANSALLLVTLVAMLSACEAGAPTGSADSPAGTGPMAPVPGSALGAPESADAPAATGRPGFGPVPITGVRQGGSAGGDVAPRDAVAASAARVTPREVGADAGWARRRVGGQPVLIAGRGHEPLTLELTGLNPQRSYHVMVGYVLGLAGEVTTGWGLRARWGGEAGEPVRFDEASARYQPDPANPWVFEAELGRRTPDDEGRLVVHVDALDGTAHSALAYVRAARSGPLAGTGAASDAVLSRDGPPRVPATTAKAFPSGDDYMTLLQRWPAHAGDGFTAGYRGEPDLGYFGSGASYESGMRTLGNFIYVYALLSGAEGYDPQVSGVDPAQLERRARMALRYMARTHRTGDLVATNGEQWGNQWQSSWWTSRLAGGAQLLWDRLHANERSMVTRVVAAEADRQLSRSPQSGNAGDSKAEENAWNTEVLAWALALMPQHPQADAWREALNRWAMNSLSTAGDRDADRVVSGRPVRAWNSTVNLNDDFRVENHGAYHAGYMAWPLQSLTWSYYALAATDQPVPDTLLHNYQQVWRRLGATHLGAGRFAYLGGKDWPQHLYGMYAIVAPTVLLQHIDDNGLAGAVEAERLRLLEWEQRLWADGSFFGGRLAGPAFTGWNSVFDSDAAAILGMAHHLRQVLGVGAGESATGGDGSDERPQARGAESDRAASDLANTLSSPHSKFVMTRGEGLTAAFSWQTLRCCFHAVNPDRDVLGMVTAGDPHMLAWQEGQLAGDFSIAGVDDAPRGVSWSERRELAGGGFATLGERWVGGSASAPAVRQQLAMVSLPQRNRVVVLDQPVAGRTVTLTDSSGLDLAVTNDIFNRMSRRVVSGEQELILASGQTDRDIALSAPWANIDGRLGVAADGSAGGLTVRTRRLRTEPWGGLRTETLRWHPVEATDTYEPGAVIRRLALGFHAGRPQQTNRLSRDLAMVDTGDAELSAAVVPVDGERDDARMVVAANFADQPRQLRLESGVSGSSPAIKRRVELPARSVRVVSAHDDQQARAGQ